MDKFDKDHHPYKKALNETHSLLDRQHIEMAEMRRLKKKERLNAGQLNVEMSKDTVFRDPVLMFPVEVWVKILDDITESTDLENCSRSCQHLQKILKPRRAEWMFTKTFKFLYHHLDKASILNCRLSCKNWTSAVDNHIDQILSLSKIPSYAKIHTLFNQKGIQSSFHQYLPITGYYFPHFNVDVRQDQLIYTSRQGIPLSKITPEMELSPRNPFLGRLVVFLDVIFTQEIVNQAIQLLENCGDHIWYLEVSPFVTSTESDMELKELKRFFSEGLFRMPNLKKLNLLMTRLFVETHLLSIIENSCKSLQSLSIFRAPYSEYIYEENATSSLALSPLSQQLQRLELITWKPNFFEGSSWSNLNTLTLQNLNKVEMLSGLIKLNLEALETLKLHFCYGYPAEDPKFLEKLLQISNKFSKLTCLEIVNTPRIPESPEILAALPKDLYAPSRLSELTVHFKDSSNPNVLTFLLRFPLLKHLYVKNLYDNGRVFRKVLKDDKIDIMGVYDAMSSRCIDDVDDLIYKAEIWKLLPFLEVLGLVLQRSAKDKSVIFTRQGYTFRNFEMNKMHERCTFVVPALGPILEDVTDWA